MTNAIDCLASLAHESRLGIFRHLVTLGPEGQSAGALAEHTGLPGATLNFHLEQLVKAGLVHRERQGRRVLYAAVYPTMDALIAYLTENCCVADPERRCE